MEIIPHMKNKYKVYKYTSKTSGKCYIGITSINIYRRSQGKGLIGYKRCPTFWRAIQKYGSNDFELKILHQNLTKEQADLMEQIEIKKHNSLAPNGYNLQSGGNSPEMHIETREKISKSSIGKIITKETRKKISKTLTGKHVGEKSPCYGKSPSKEVREKISKSLTGRKLSEETKRKMTKSRQGANHPMYGRKHSKASIKKMIEKNIRIK